MTRDSVKTTDPLFAGMVSQTGGLQSWARGLAISFEIAWSRLRRGWWDITEAFPYPTDMLDAAMRLASAMPGLFISLPFEGQKQILLDEIRQRKLGQRLIRVDDAVSAFFDTQVETLKTATFTSEGGIVEWFMAAFARFAFRWFKNVTFILKVIKVQNEAEFVQLVIQSWKSKLNLMRTVIVILAIAAVVISYGIALSMFSFALNFGIFAENILPQDSKRVRKRRGRMQFRVNARTGYDFARP